MAIMSFCTIMYAVLLLPVALAVPWIGAIPTPAGLMAMNGMSPRPTEAPGDGIIPHDLLKRDQIIFPPPANWCGFVTSDYYNPLTCNTAYSCTSSRSAYVCCSPNLPCAFYTGCVGLTTTSSSHKTDILYCSGLSSAACGTNIFKGLSTLYNYYCTITSESTEIEYLNSFYSTEIGSTVGPDGVATPISGVRSPSPITTSITTSPSSSTSPASSISITDAATTSSFVSPQPATASPHTGLAVGAIAGIAVGAGCIALAVIAGIIVCCIMQKRRRARTAAQQVQPQPQAAFNHNAPMQQVFTDQAYPPNYAQSGQYPPSGPGVLNEAPSSPQTSTYASTYNGHPSPINSPLLAHDPTNRMSNIIPPPLPYNHSTPTPISPVSPKPPIVGNVENSASNYFKPPSSPTITEAGGMGAKIGHIATNDKDQVHEVSGVPIHVRDQNQSQFHGQSQGINVHEISAQPEPKYTAYSPTLSTQHEQSFNTYTQSSVPEWSSTTIKNHQQPNEH